MAQVRKIVGLVGLFDEPDDLVRAAEKVRDAGYGKWDCHTPYPVHGLDEAMGLKRSLIPMICLGMGFVGGLAAMLMQWWMDAVDYPIVIGGKPLFSWPAFVPITFELFVSFTALSTVGCLIFFCRLWRWHSPLHDTQVMAEVTSNRFAVVLLEADKNFSEEKSRSLLEETGCEDIRELVELEEV